MVYSGRNTTVLSHKIKQEIDFFVKKIEKINLSFLSCSTLVPDILKIKKIILKDYEIISFFFTFNAQITGPSCGNHYKAFF